MAVTYQLAAGIIQFTTTGDVEHRSGLDVLKAGLAEAAASPVANGWHLLFDLRASTENRDPNELRGIAAVIAAHRTFLSGRCAVVATDPLHYGLSRMFGVFMSGLGFDVNVCNHLEDAKHWLHTRQPA